MADTVLGTHRFDEADNTEIDGLSFDTGGGTWSVPHGTGAVQVDVDRGDGGARNVSYSGWKRAVAPAYTGAPDHVYAEAQLTSAATTQKVFATVDVGSSDSSTNLRGYSVGWAGASVFRIYRNGVSKASSSTAGSDDDWTRVERADSGSDKAIEGFYNGSSTLGPWTDTSALADGVAAFSLNDGIVKDFAYGTVGAASTAPTDLIRSELLRSSLLRGLAR